MTDEPSNNGDEPKDELAARLAAIEEKAKHLKAGSRMPDPPEWNYKRPASMRKKVEDNGYRGLAVGLSIAYSLVGCMLLGWFLGWLVDRARGGGSAGGQAIGGLFGCILGMVSAIWLMNRVGGGRD